MNKLVKILISATLISIPLYVIRCKNFFFCPSPIPLNLLEVMIIITVLVWIGEKIISKRNIRLELSRLFNSVPLLSRILIFSFLFFAFIDATIFSERILPLGIFKGYFFEPFILFLILLDYLNKEKNIKLIIWSILGAGFWFSLLTIAERMLGLNPFNPQEFEQRGRVSGLYTSSNAVGLFIVPLVFLALGYLIYLIKEKKLNYLNLEVRLAALTIATLVLGQIVSGSRGGYLALSSGIIFFCLFILLKYQAIKLQEKITKVFKLILAIFVGFVLIFFFALPGINEFNQKNKIIPALTPRLCLWEGSFNMVKQNPIFGAGLREFQTKYENFHTCSSETALYPHNIFLDFWLETGLLGLISFVALCTYHFFKLLSSREISYFNLGLATIFVTYLAHGLLDNPYFNNDLAVSFWVFFALILFSIKQTLGFSVKRIILPNRRSQ